MRYIAEATEARLTMARLDADAALAELGQCGRYQLRNYLLILVPIAFSAVYNAQYIFAAADVDYRCLVEECEESPPQWQPGSWEQWAAPPDPACWRRPPRHHNATCDPADFYHDRVKACRAWIYRDHNSIVAEFDLACEQWKRTLVGTVHSAGLLVALPITGYVSDAFGRRTALVATAVSAGVMGLARSWSPNYIVYLIFEFLDAALGSGVYSTGFILALETVGPKRRVLGGSVISCTYALGQVALALVASFVPYWRDLTRVLYTPSLLFFVYYFLLYESIRWLLSKGRRREAARVLQRAATINGRTVSKETLRRLEDEADDVIQSHVASGTPGGKEKREGRSLVLQVISSRVLMLRVCVCSFWWITTTFVYYGLSINSVSLAGDAYLNYALTSLVEIPGYVLGVLTLDRFGRKRSIMTALWACGASLVVLPFVTEAADWAGTFLTMLGKLCISMTFSSIYIYTSELFPTNARHSLLGACSMVGRIGSILAPQTPLLMEVMPSLPYLLFGVMAACSALLMLLTPETLNVSLPDTVDQAEAIKSPVSPADAHSPHRLSRNSVSNRNRDTEMS